MRGDQLEQSFQSSLNDLKTYGSIKHPARPDTAGLINVFNLFNLAFNFFRCDLPTALG